MPATNAFETMVDASASTKSKRRDEDRRTRVVARAQNYKERRVALSSYTQRVDEGKMHELIKAMKSYDSLCHENDGLLRANNYTPIDFRCLIGNKLTPNFVVGRDLSVEIQQIYTEIEIVIHFIENLNSRNSMYKMLYDYVPDHKKTHTFQQPPIFQAPVFGQPAFNGQAPVVQPPVQAPVVQPPVQAPVVQHPVVLPPVQPPVVLPPVPQLFVSQLGEQPRVLTREESQIAHDELNALITRFNTNMRFTRDQRATTAKEQRRKSTASSSDFPVHEVLVPPSSASSSSSSSASTPTSRSLNSLLIPEERAEH